MNLEPNKPVGSHLQGNDLDSALACLIAAFVSANGVKPGFYKEVGAASVMNGHVSLDKETGRISRDSEDHIWQSLIDRSYTRGEYVARLIAKRICLAIDEINEEGAHKFMRKLANSDKESAKKLLIPLYGMGPKSFEVYWTLASESTT